VIATFAILELGFAIWVAFFAHGRVGPRVGYGPDSFLYLRAARAPVWSRDFLAGPGAFGFLLLAKLCARNLRAIVVVQSLIAVGAWTFLATSVCHVLRANAAKWVALLGILGVGLAPGILQWNAMITTESLSMSSLCAVLGCGIRLVDRGSRRDLAWFVAAMAAFAYTRDTNALVVGGVGVVAIVCAIRSELRVRAVVIGVAGIVLVSSATALANAAEPPRWYWPLAETTAVRLLADADATRYLVDHGFPWDPEMATLPQRYIYIYDPVRTGASFAAFRAWVRDDGRRVYLDYLVSHPGWALRKPFADRDAFFGAGEVEVYGRVYGNRPGGLYTVIGAAAVPTSPVLGEVWAAAAAIALVVLLVRRRVRPAVAGAIALAGIVAVAGFYAAWHGDALEVHRHALSAAVQLRIVVWIVTALVVDALVTPSRSDVRVPEQADLHEEQHERAPHDEPTGASTDASAH
jgi:hypothetical protein